MMVVLRSGSTLRHDLERPGKVTLGTRVCKETGIPIQSQRLDDLLTQRAALHDFNLRVNILFVTRISAHHILDIQHLHRIRSHFHRSRRTVNGCLAIRVDEIDCQYAKKRKERHPFVFEDHQEVMSPMQTARRTPSGGSPLLAVGVIGNKGLHGY